MFEIRRFTQDRTKEWNDFVRNSKNGTFLFDRSYMDYHADRFSDYSLMVFRRGKLYALLSANADGTTLVSHQGLTYGGLVMNEKTTASDVVQIFKQINTKLKENGFRRVIYKPVPWIYHRQPSEEDLYAIVEICHAKLIGRGLSSTICQSCTNKWYRVRENGSRQAQRRGLVVEASEEWDGFWEILSNNLQERYQLNPVHTVEEIKMLHQRFPQYVQLTVVKEGNHIVGGTVLYQFEHVVHSQYIATNNRGRDIHALDYLFSIVIPNSLRDHSFFDFGISTEKHGSYLNEGLIYQKEGFGGRGICYDWYEWDLSIQ